MKREKPWAVKVINLHTNEVAHTIPCRSEERAGIVERGVRRNLGENYHTEIVYVGDGVLCKRCLLLEYCDPEDIQGVEHKQWCDDRTGENTDDKD